jgi:histidinol dehydrogenase
MKIVKYENLPEAILAGRGSDLDHVISDVNKIVNKVIDKGDEALKKFSRKFDGVEINDFRVSSEEINEAAARVSKDFIEAVNTSIENVRKFHRSHSYIPGTLREGGMELGRLFIPYQRVGIYVPGGKANYPSTVIMGSVPAKVAGVREIIVCTPPGKDGKVSDEVLAAASLCKVNSVYRVGGAQAIAAMAYGTETVPKVEKVVGPGNIFVTAAKKLVRDHVAIDMLAGPSEVMVIGNGTTNPVFVAAELLAQAEHDEDAWCIFVTDSEDVAKSVEKEIEKQLSDLPRKKIASRSIKKNCYIVMVKDMNEAMKFANEFAPEHLVLMAKGAQKMLGSVRNAGSVFVGDFSPVAAGDYCTGPNHILPTGGMASMYSGLAVEDFFKRIPYQLLSKGDLKKLLKTVKTMAEVEGLEAHARSVEKRLEQ